MHRSRQLKDISPMELQKFAGEPGFAVLREGERWRVYLNATEVLAARDEQSLTSVLARIEEHIHAGGEAAGFLHYEAGYALEPRLRPLLPKYREPLCWFGLYESAMVLDDIPVIATQKTNLLRNFELSIGENEYHSKLDEIRRLIEAGEIYQVNFTIRASVQLEISPWEAFCTLFRRHPVPYAAFVNTGSERIVSLSPELFFATEDRRIRVKPMKGTAPRGRTLQEDLTAADELRASDKNCAENVMIVDLMRNDLGRICVAGSVKTSSLFEVERYPSLWQMTSTVEGELLEGCAVESILRALFPSGSVTGAPKIRAMEHIAKLEHSPRGVYTGAIGFFAPRKSCFNVAIRTIQLQHSRGTMGIGSGIVFDSDPVSEWQECQSKAAFLIQSVPEFEIIETMYWNASYRLLEEHLARMRDSAEYFDFAFDEDRIRAELQAVAETFSFGPKRVRVLLSRDGGLEISHTEFVPCNFGRVGISEKRVSSQDRFLSHKTTNRDLYSRELAVARSHELDDVLFFNERGELTEGTVHNIFLVKDGKWRTPPVDCGLLPGIFRAEILQSRANAYEAVLRIEDLKSADAIYLCNSVRGVFPVKVIWDLERANLFEEAVSVV